MSRTLQEMIKSEKLQVRSVIEGTPTGYDSDSHGNNCSILRNLKIAALIVIFENRHCSEHRLHA